MIVQRVHSVSQKDLTLFLKAPDPFFKGEGVWPYHSYPNYVILLDLAETLAVSYGKSSDPVFQKMINAGKEGSAFLVSDEET